jgi:2-polyprenyl-3-methyl-5-hydroxy-6-metoxy-1,4-benzoquinol methylase
MEMLLPDQLQALWQAVDQKRLTAEEFIREQDRLLGEYRATWTQALMDQGQDNLQHSLLRELGDYVQCDDIHELRRRCESAVETLKGEWHAQVHEGEERAIERFYDQSQTTIYELMWWHTLRDDMSPLAYVTALHLARQHGGRQYLDFGAGVGSGGILFARHGLNVTLADISSTLLRFSQWRFKRRGLPTAYIDLKAQELPQNAYDFVTAMDVFEHLVDPVATVEQLWKALRPGGFLYARIAAEVDEDRPQHIVQDFGPTFQRMETLGFVQVWQDAWLWGHQVFQKTAGH